MGSPSAQGPAGGTVTDSLPFSRVWAVDFEFAVPPGGLPVPQCCVAREVNSDRLYRLWFEPGQPPPPCPYPTGTDDLIVAYMASAEIGCHLALGWPVPERVLDLHAEFRLQRSGLGAPCGFGLLGAMAYFGLDAMSQSEKKEMRDLVLRGGPHTPEEAVAILDYCQQDVDGTALLLKRMCSGLDLPRALLRGRYMAAVSRMEYTGTPIDFHTLSRLRVNWDGLKHRLIEAVDSAYGVYEGTVFKEDRFASWLGQQGIPWPRTLEGRLALDRNTFRQAARSHPAVAALAELRSTLSELRLNNLQVGDDGKNRTPLWAFGAKTGRNQPSNSRFIFGPSRWIRGLIKPKEGNAVAYIDWGQQEFGIAAALSKDSAMLAAYRTGDPYLAFAKQAGAAPADATKDSHRSIRDRYKQCILAIQYGQEAEGLASRLGVSVAEARVLMDQHRRTYARYWQWSDAVQDQAMLHGSLRAAFGWQVGVGPDANPRSLRNFPMQANGAEMMRLAAIRATEAGISVCCPVHDAFLIEAPVDRIDAEVGRMQNAMAWASRQVLVELELTSDAKVVRAPDRYMDDAGRTMWDTVMGLLPPE